MLKYTAKLIATISMIATLTGCASIVSGTKQNVAVSTGNVTGATCELENNKGKWFINQTPGMVEVHRSYHDLKVNCTKRGVRGRTVVGSNTRPLAFGNVLFGGVIGAGIDVADGAAYDYPNSISVPMGRVA